MLQQEEWTEAARDQRAFSLAHGAALQSPVSAVFQAGKGLAFFLNPSSQLHLTAYIMLSFLLLVYVVASSHTHLGNYKPSH